mmetsp:Transcript_15029/g.32741  ORF Transcript_15029/g.32741 Transcript_15029/m.32741 type:complete len:128 (-) Transcript_15029:2-385(-)
MRTSAVSAGLSLSMAILRHVDDDEDALAYLALWVDLGRANDIDEEEVNESEGSTISARERMANMAKTHAADSERTMAIFLGFAFHHTVSLYHTTSWPAVPYRCLCIHVQDISPIRTLPTERKPITCM